MASKRKLHRYVKILLTVPAVALSIGLLGIFLSVAINWGDHQVSSKFVEENFKPGMSKAEIWEILPSNALILIMPSEDPFTYNRERVGSVDPDKLSASTSWKLNYSDLGSLFFRQESYRLYFDDDKLESILIETKFGLDKHGHQGFSDSSEGDVEPQ